MTNEKNIIEFYKVVTMMKNNIRQGWLDWNINTNRVESIAEHLYGSILLAIVIKDEKNYNVDISKVVLMLALHDLDKAYLRDYSLEQPSKEERREALLKALKGLASKDNILFIIDEYDKNESEEAKFARQVNAIESDLQALTYDNNGTIDVNNGFVDPYFKDYYGKGLSFAQMWTSAQQNNVPYDENFKAISNEIISSSTGTKQQ